MDKVFLLALGFAIGEVLFDNCFNLTVTELVLTAALGLLASALVFVLYVFSGSGWHS